MKRLIFTLCLVLMPLSAFAQSAVMPLSIKDATAFCEKNVPQNCMDNTCPAYCNTMRGAAQIVKCKAECTLANRCKLKPLASMDDPKNLTLDADNRDKLMACIAEKRDPAGTKSGRRMDPWEKLMTPSMKKALGVN
jgi:hypothetical protein